MRSTHKRGTNKTDHHFKLSGHQFYEPVTRFKKKDYFAEIHDIAYSKNTRHKADKILEKRDQERITVDSSRKEKIVI
ncbi:Uncharacterized protein FWK35_00020461 [Aphis craccivora]|uniref:Uncharacterized protein n=1 Tax=Aphis craccivora TaxID=307492 RepID=A0A6G0XPT1_APHCR|nr:Uncharacterized protein FWK35_00020461 [Aphis craccivora]